VRTTSWDASGLDGSLAARNEESLIFMGSDVPRWSSPSWLFTFFITVFFGGLRASRTDSAAISALVVLLFIIFTVELWLDLRRRRASSEVRSNLSHWTFIVGCLGMALLLFMGLRESSDSNVWPLQILVLPFVSLGYWFVHKKLQRSASA